MPRPLPTKTETVRLIGGPMDGREVEVVKGADECRVGPFFRYTYAGRDGKTRLMARAPKSRRMAKFIHWYVGQHDRDPRVVQ